MTHRSGFVAVVGRPNAGKSTLVNALVGTKVAITSSKPQTTRHVIRGIVQRPDGQIVLVDTPGVHRPRTLLGERLNALVEEAWTQVDVVMLCLPADEAIGPGDRRIAALIASLPARIPLIAAITKVDKVSRDKLAHSLLAASALGEELSRPWDEIVPISAVKDDQVDLLADLLLARLPEGPQLYPAEDVTDEPELIMIAELVREAALEGVRDELPHSLAVVVEELIPRPDRPEGRPLLDVLVNVYVERDSQKSIIIGKGGSRLKDVGSRARVAIAEYLGTPVHLDLHVKVAKDWQTNPAQLRKLGF